MLRHVNILVTCARAHLLFVILALLGILMMGRPAVLWTLLAIQHQTAIFVHEDITCPAKIDVRIVNLTVISAPVSTHAPSVVQDTC